MNDTPETSEAWDSVSRTPDGMYESLVTIGSYAYAMLDHAEKMERERDEARRWNAEGKINGARCAKERDEVQSTLVSALRLLADIREAVGDRTGKLMQAELVERCRELRKSEQSSFDGPPET